MSKHTAGLRRWGLRAAVAGVTIAGALSVTTSASAIVKNPNTLCDGHDGVSVVYRKAGVVVCNDGEEFDI